MIPPATLVRRGVCPVAGLLILAAFGIAACARQPAPTSPTYSSTMFQQMNQSSPRDQARREALALAEFQARNQIREKLYQLRLSDGRALGDLAAIDPFVRAVVQDNLRAARIEDRTVTDAGLVSVTVKMDLSPLYQLIAEYPRHSIR